MKKLVPVGDDPQLCADRWVDDDATEAAVMAIVDKLGNKHDARGRFAKKSVPAAKVLGELDMDTTYPAGKRVRLADGREGNVLKTYPKSNILERPGDFTPTIYWAKIAMDDGRDEEVPMDGSVKVIEEMDPADTPQYEELKKIFGKKLDIFQKHEDNGAIRIQMNELLKVPPPVLNLAADHVNKVVLSDASIADYEPGITEFGRPRGWPEGSSFYDVGGTYRDAERRLFSGKAEDDDYERVRYAMIHELGHALDYAIRANAKKHFGFDAPVGAWDPGFGEKRSLRLPELSPYFRQPGQAGLNETFAEAVQLAYGSNNPKSGYAKDFAGITSYVEKYVKKEAERHAAQEA